MEYVKTKNSIKIRITPDFDIRQILDCGQIFRYKIEGNCAEVFSMDKKARVITSKSGVEIITNDVEYFEQFFDLKTDYFKIKEKLINDSYLKEAISFGSGIRILNNDFYEMIVSFIISANNNIKRIKKSIETLCEKFGTKMCDYHAFPTLEQIKRATVEDFKIAGLGYRAEQLFDTVQSLTKSWIENLKTQSKEEQFEELVKLKGVGEKVANCIMLFGLGVKDVFPVDTWINKVYNKLNNTNETNRKKITRELSARYGNLSGYAQQYFFFYYRENNIK